MLYSSFILLFGIYLGQELAIPSVKLTVLSIMSFLNNNPPPQPQHFKINYLERFINYFLNNENK